MAVDTRYRQVGLRSDDGEHRVDTVYIPNSFARVGRRITVGDDPTVWVVTDVYGSSVDAKHLESVHYAHKRWDDVLS